MFLAALAALFPPLSLTECHFRIWTQIVTFENFRHLIRGMSGQKDRKGKKLKSQKVKKTKI